MFSVFLLRAIQQTVPQGEKVWYVEGTWNSGERGREGEREGKTEIVRNFRNVFNTIKRYGDQGN